MSPVRVSLLTLDVDPNSTSSASRARDVPESHVKVPQDVVMGAPLIRETPEILQKLFTMTTCGDYEVASEGNVDNESKTSCSSANIFFSVRSTAKYHKTRLKFLVDTWFPITPADINIFTDSEDGWLRRYMMARLPPDAQPRIVVTDCPESANEKWGLLCKMYWEYRTFLASNKAWFCHFDDDTYVNVEMLQKLLSLYSSDERIYIGRSPSSKPVISVAYNTEIHMAEMWMLNDTANGTTWQTPPKVFQRVGFHYALGGAGFCFTRPVALDMRDFALGSRMLASAASISLPDDCVIGYIITHLLGIPLISTELMHTHFEDLSDLSGEETAKQVTLSYALAAGSESKHENRETAAFFKARDS